MANKFEELISKAKAAAIETDPTETPTPVPTAATTKSKPAEKDVNMGAKIPESWRRYWTSQAKDQGVTIKSILIEAMIDRFGEPPNYQKP